MEVRETTESNSAGQRAELTNDFQRIKAETKCHVWGPDERFVWCYGFIK